MKALADVTQFVALVLADPAGTGETSGERIALYGMIGVLGSALIGAIGVALNTWLGRRPVAVADEAARLAVLEFWIAYVLGVNPDAISTGHETWDEVHGGATRPPPSPAPRPRP